MGFIDRIIRFIQNWLRKKTDEERRRLALILTSAFVVILTFSVIMSIKGSGGDKDPDYPERQRLLIAIPAEELFLPDEPDFIPGVQLERDRRSSWNEQDALVFWQDPLKAGEEGWREKIEAAVDEFLERIP